MTIGRKMGLGFGVLLALVVTLAVVVLFNLSTMNRQFSFVIQHDAPVIANARHLSKLVVDMETGQRGFVITGEDEFLEPYDNALASFADLLNEEKALVSDNPAQVKLLERIDASVQEWQKEAATPEIAMRRKVGNAGRDAYRLQKVLSQGVGKRLMDEFMALGHEIEVAFSEQGDWEGAYAVEIIENCMADREDGQRGFLITGREEFLDKYHAGEQNKLPEYFTRLRSLISDRGRRNELSERVDRLEELTAEWSRQAAEPEINARREMNKHPESIHDVAALLAAGTGKRILDRIREDFSKFIEEEERLTAIRFASASQASRSTTNTTILLALLSVIFGGIMATKITRGITKPVRRLAGAVEMVAKGDLAQEMEITSKDEIGVLSRSFNLMVGNLKRLEEDREQSAERLGRAIQAADSANQAKSEFLANMSHEIRTPMTAIVGFAENLLDADQSESEKLNCVHTIRRNGEYLLDLINDILDLSKIEAGKMTIERRDCQPCRIVAEVASLMRVRADAKMLPFNIEYIGAIPETIQCDPTRLRQILINLIGNAIKFTEVGAVRLLTRFVEGPRGQGAKGPSDVDKPPSAPHESSDRRTLGPSLQFDVMDTGRGMTEEQTAKLFHPFMQADASTTRQFGGTGLGLTISKRFARLLGGDLTLAQTEMGVGTTFRTTVATGSLDGVKMLEDPMVATVVADTENTVAPATPSDLQGLRILLAEDGPDNQQLIRFVLKRAGADVTVEENGKLALDAALAARDKGNPFDVILMDMQMPVMDGYDATRQLRLKGYTAPIIALTAHAMASDRKRCIDAGCDDYATKPIDRKRLIETVARHTLAIGSFGI
ncbi:MAG: CHASE3 domain-containing protein [Planctomycetes bacterium]|nr:CHASE3 domain-containing protein [Planctomycetota bacterium]